MQSRNILIAAALVMMTGVAAGAFGAHAIRGSVPDGMLAVWQTAVLYQLVHGLGMVLAALLAVHFRAPRFNLAGVVMLAGVLIFSGSLYTLVLSGVTWLGAITPIGGAAFLAGWGIFAWAAARAA